MLEIYIGPAFDPQRVIVNSNKTVREVFAENHIPLNPADTIVLNSSRLGDRELDATLADLGVVSGDLITSTQKLNGAK